MLHVSPENSIVPYATHTTEANTVFLFAVDSTHSSGKTTLLRDYISDPSKTLLSDPECDFGTDPNNTYPYVCVTEQLGRVVIPVVIASEAATDYNTLYPELRALTDGYNKESQAAISLRAIGNAQEGAIKAAAMAKKLQHDRDQTISGVITDRAALSGFVYANTRLPNEEHQFVDLSNISDVATPSYIIDLQHIVDDFMQSYDKVFLPNHDEVELVDNGLRDSDRALRSEIATKIAEAYDKTLGKSKVVAVSGNRNARAIQLEVSIRKIFRNFLREQDKRTD